MCVWEARWKRRVASVASDLPPESMRIQKRVSMKTLASIVSEPHIITMTSGSGRTPLRARLSTRETVEPKPAAATRKIEMPAAHAVPDLCL